MMDKLDSWNRALLQQHEHRGLGLINTKGATEHKALRTSVLANRRAVKREHKVEISALTRRRQNSSRLYVQW